MITRQTWDDPSAHPDAGLKGKWPGVEHTEKQANPAARGISVFLGMLNVLVCQILQ